MKSVLNKLIKCNALRKGMNFKNITLRHIDYDRWIILIKENNEITNKINIFY